VREKLLSIDIDVHASLPKAAYNQSGELNENKQRVADAMAAFFNNNKSSGASQRHFDFSNVARRSDSQAVAAREDFYSNPQMQAFSPAQEYLQIHDSYIVAQADDGFLIIDQHALHERIMYEELCRRLASDESSKLQSQKLLIPETFEPTSAQLDVINNNKDLLDRLGIELEPFGPGIFAVQGFPTLLNKVRPMEFITDLLDILCDSVGKIDSERLLHKILDMAACKAAVKAGQKLSPAEIAQLLADKQTIERAARCPHGRPTVIKFGLAELEKQFKRT
jgi:DNA mismatch repair protein MutL